VNRKKGNLNLNQHANFRTVHITLCAYYCAQLSYTIPHRAFRLFPS